MKNSNAGKIPSLRNVITTAAKSARRKAFRKGLPVAISKNGRVVYIYKDNREIIAGSTPTHTITT